MSQLKSEKNIDLDLSKGFSWYGVIKISRQNVLGRKVIYETKQKNTPIKLTIGLDKEGGLNVWIVDLNNKQFTVGPLNKDLFLGRFVFLGFKLNPLESQKSLSELILSVNNKLPLVKEIEANLRFGGVFEYSLGSNIKGEESVSFDLAEMMVYSRSLDINEANNLFEYAKKEYKLDGQ